MRGALILCVLFLAGCGQPPSTGVVARVNDHLITTEDFRRELDSSSSVFRSYTGLAPEVLKARILDEMVINQLLLEEAQKLGFDKKEAFMREIESYWRQALLKELVNEKGKEFLAAVNVSDEQIRALYSRQGEQLELDITCFADESSARELSAAGEAFGAVANNLSSRIVRRDKGWWIAGDFPLDVEAPVWTLKVGEVSQPLYMAENGWMVIRVVARQRIEQKPFDEIAGDLRKSIAARSTRVMMDAWIAELTGKARIVRNDDVIAGVEFGQKKEIVMANDDQAANRRKILIVDKKFQNKFIAKFFTMVSVGSFLTVSIVYFFCGQTLTTVFKDSRLKIMSTADFMLPGLVISTVLVILVVGAATAWMALYVSHRLAGPIFRLTQDILSFQGGNLKQIFRLREKDEMKQLAQGLNEMARKVQHDVAVLKMEMNAIEKDAAGLPEQTKEHLKKMKLVLDRYHA